MDPVMLKPIGLFEGVSDEVLTAIGAISNITTYSKGELVFTEGDYAEQIYILVEGEVAIRVKLTSRPESVTVALLKQDHESFGWSGVVPPFYYTASALCETDCKIISIPGKQLIDIFRQAPTSGFEIMRRITEVVSSRLRNSRAVLLKTL